MSVIRRRNRQVYFRVSEDEFQRFVELCNSAGARSISDLARSAIEKLLRESTDGPDGVVLERLKSIDDHLHDVDLTLRRLTQLLDNQDP